MQDTEQDINLLKENDLYVSVFVDNRRFLTVFVSDHAFNFNMSIKSKYT